MLNFFLRIFCCVIFSLFAALANAAELPKSLQEAQFYFLVDADSGEVLLSRNPDVRIAPSSMTKVMTAYAVFDQLKKGRITLQNECHVGKDAWRKSGSSMFLNYGDVVTIEDLVKGLLVVSGNDASIALAESISGGTENFVSLMNIKAKELGLKNSHFRNPHGLAQDGHYMSIRDIATLITRLYKDFPQYSHFLGLQEFTYRKITQRNRNPLIKSNYDGGVVGGKTGHTNEGGYGVVGIVKRDHRKLVAVVNKARTSKQRARVITDMMDYGFGHYKKIVLFEKGRVIGKVNTWLGKKASVDAMALQEISINIPRDQSLSSVEVKMKSLEPLYAPLSKGVKVATLVVEVKGYKTFEFSLFASESVERVGLLRKINQVLRYKIARFFHIISN